MSYRHPSRPRSRRLPVRGISGPHLGDDSIQVNCVMVASSGNLDCSSIIVRIGSALVAVMEQGNETNGDVYLNQVTEAAIRKFQATAS